MVVLLKQNTMVTMIVIPKKEITRQVFCRERCRSMEDHTIFFIEDTNVFQKTVIIFNQKCRKCEHSQVNRLYLDDWNHLVKNDY